MNELVSAPRAPHAPSPLITQALSDGLLVMSPATLLERVRIIDEIRSTVMQEGCDYYSLQNRKVKDAQGNEREVPQYSLSKAGAEKLNMVFGLTPDIESVVILDDPNVKRTIQVGDWADDPSRSGRKKKIFVDQIVTGAYEVKSTCSIWATNGRLLARASGTCNNTEGAFRSTPYSDAKNPILKRAEKRALVAAVLMATASSGMFTQDLEDMPQDDHGAAQGVQAASSAPAAANAPAASSGTTTGQPAPQGWLSAGQEKLLFAKGKNLAVPVDEVVVKRMISYLNGKGSWQIGKPLLEEIAKDTEKGLSYWAQIKALVEKEAAVASAPAPADAPADAAPADVPPPPAGDGF